MDTPPTSRKYRQRFSCLLTTILLLMAMTLTFVVQVVLANRASGIITVCDPVMCPPDWAEDGDTNPCACSNSAGVHPILTAPQALLAKEFMNSTVCDAYTNPDAPTVVAFDGKKLH